MPAIPSIASAVLIAALTSATALAQNAPAAAADGARGASARGSTQASGAEFLVAAARAGYGELRAARVALTNALRPDTREYARRMIEDHTRSQERLKELADSLDAKLPADLEPLHQARLHQLEMTRGAAFDREYLSEYGIAAHQIALRLYREWADAATRPEVQGFARESIPVLERHLQQAQALYAGPAGSGKP